MSISRSTEPALMNRLATLRAENAQLQKLATSLATDVGALRAAREIEQHIRSASAAVALPGRNRRRLHRA
jgi:hypothetical protein